MIPTNELILLITAVNTAAIGIITAYFKSKHDENKTAIANICDTCVYDYTPIKKK